MTMSKTGRKSRVSKATTVVASLSILAGSLAGAAPAMAKPGDVVNPLVPESYRYTGEFGPRCVPAINAGAIHEGQDMTSPDGDTIRAAANGVVSKVKNPSGGGAGYIIVRHVIDGKTYHTAYFHMWKADQFVKNGQTVKKGQKIALVGNSGPSANAHLHFEVWQGAWKSGKALNPTTWMKSQGIDLKADAYAAWSSTKPTSCTYYFTQNSSLRSTASSTSAVVKNVSKGAVMTARPVTSEVSGQYMKVTSGGKTGWVHQSVVSPNKVSTAPQTTPANIRYSTTDELNIRSGAGVSNGIVKVVPKGSHLITTGKRSGDWFQVKSGATTGWVNSYYLVKAPVAPLSSTNASVHRAASVLASATSWTKTGVINGGTRIFLTGKASGSRLEAKTPVGTGWIDKSHVKGDTTICSGANFVDNPTKTSLHDSVRWMQCEGLTNGYSDGSFGKSRAITRGEAAAFLYRMSGSPSTGVPASSPFKDMNSDATHYRAAAWMQSEGIVNGYTDGTFRPNRNITRGEMAKIAYKVADGNYTAPAKSPFSDVKAGGSFYEPISWMKAKGIVDGYSDGSYRPGRQITRAETSKILQSVDKFIG